MSCVVCVCICMCVCGCVGVSRWVCGEQARECGAAPSLTATLQKYQGVTSIMLPSFAYTLEAHAAATVIQRSWLGRKDMLRRMAVLIQYAFK